MIIDRLSLNEIQEFRNDLFHKQADANKKLNQIFLDNKEIPSAKELFNNIDYEVISLDYTLDPNKSIIEIKKEIESLIKSSFVNNIKNKRFLGNFSYVLEKNNRQTLVHLIMDYFDWACIDLTGIVLGSSFVPNSTECPTTDNIKVRFCIFIK
jgi:hypothetical protein